jgi:signal transduction histidine kinase
MVKSFLKKLGPGLITGAADDDPSGIATYSSPASSSLNSVFIKINNKGEPIFSSKIQNIFDPLVRHEENAQANYFYKSSLGLGLYITKEIVLAHNGSVNVSSSKADGTTFEIELPR